MRNAVRILLVIIGFNFFIMCGTSKWNQLNSNNNDILSKKELKILQNTNYESNFFEKKYLADKKQYKITLILLKSTIKKLIDLYLKEQDNELFDKLLKNLLINELEFNYDSNLIKDNDFNIISAYIILNFDNYLYCISQLLANDLNNRLVFLNEASNFHFRNSSKNYNYIEYWWNLLGSDKMKIRINYYTWFKIVNAFFSTEVENESIYDRVFDILKTFPCNTVNFDVVFRMSVLIVDNFQYYYFLFLNLGIDQSILIESYFDLENLFFWEYTNPNKYNWVEGIKTVAEINLYNYLINK